MTSRLLHYEILGELGRGGMGVVYKARDTHLDRVVAIKTLPADRLADPNRKLRFVQEAKAASALNHPNIVTIHDINSDQGVDFMVMEYVDGKTLDEVIPAKGVRPPLALKYAVQIADALAKAHGAGILHRDVKPSNVMVTEEGRVKVLDFGLAKLSDRAGTSEDATLTRGPLTEEGAVVGTAAYMSPEQAEGRKLDGRSDVFSFGSVLYEMVTGQRPFSGESRVALLAKVLNEDAAPPSRIAPSVPPDLEKAILRCLRKDPARRFQTMADLKVALEDLQDESAFGTQAQAAPPPARSSRKWALAGLLSLLVAGGFFAWREFRSPDRSQPLQAVPLTTYPGAESNPSFSPDGNQVAFTWGGPKQDNTDIYIQMIGSGSPLRLTTDPGVDFSPAWSPDGRWIAFVRGSVGPGKLEVRLIPPLGGSERKLAEIEIRQSFFPAPYLAWTPDARFLIATDSPGERRPNALFTISVETGEKKPLTSPRPPLFGDSMPAVSPDGRSIVFGRAAAAAAGEILWLALGEGGAPAGEPRRLTPAALNAYHPAWMPDGEEILFSARSGLWRLSVRGQSAPARLPFVGEDGFMPAVSRPPPGRPGRLVYVRRSLDTNIWRVETSGPGATASSPPVAAISSTRWDTNAQFSPDGRRVSFASSRSGDLEIWLADPDGGNTAQLTSLGAPQTGTPRWSPDGQTIVFDSNLEGQYELYAISASGGKPRRLTSHPANDHVPSFSRDGRWIYFSTNRSGETQIWKMPSSGGEAIQVTQNGGYVAFESPDGAQLYYTQTATAPSALWRLPVSGGRPVKVLEGVVRRAFVILEKGVYYASLEAPSQPGAKLLYFDFATGKSTSVATLGREIDLGLTATADGRTILYTKVDSSVNDLMLVENFR